MSKAYNLDELPEESMPTSWGHWTFNEDLLTLVHAETRYEIDLESCTTSAKVLDWIVQITGKAWASAEDVAALVRALDDLIGLQENFCGFGKEHVFVDARSLLKKRSLRGQADGAQTPELS